MATPITAPLVDVAQSPRSRRGWRLHWLGVPPAPVALLVMIVLHSGELSPRVGLVCMGLLAIWAFAMGLGLWSLWKLAVQRWLRAALSALAFLVANAHLLALVDGAPSVYDFIRFALTLGCALAITLVAGLLIRDAFRPGRLWYSLAALPPLVAVGSFSVLLSSLGVFGSMFDERHELVLSNADRQVEVISGSCFPPDNACECLRRSPGSTRVYLRHLSLPWTLARHRLNGFYEPSGSSDETVVLQSICDTSRYVLDPVTGDLQPRQ
jgi:hypothetical protein